MSAKRHPTTRFYQVRRSTEWARFWITDDGCITILSDYGNYGYWFGAPAQEFRRFLVDCEPGYYITTKLAGGQREFDGPRTVKIIREHILEYRRRGDIGADEARTQWQHLEDCKRMDTPEEFRDWLESSMFYEFDWEAWEWASYGPPMQVRMFIKKIWPLFIEQLKAELATESEGAGACL